MVMLTREIGEGRDLRDDLVLPLASGEPWWYWLGGRPCLDLVNTKRERWRRNVETLVTDDDLCAWLISAQLLPEPMKVRRGVLAEARELREAIDAAALAVVECGKPPAAAVKLIDSWLVHAGERPQLSLEHGAFVLGERRAADSPRRALGTIALDAAHMLGQPEQCVRVRVCASETCSARFYDRSPAGKRRWCSMKTCGNVARRRAATAPRRPWRELPLPLDDPRRGRVATTAQPSPRCARASFARPGAARSTTSRCPRRGWCSPRSPSGSS